jgi:hypothetical protein
MVCEKIPLCCCAPLSCPSDCQISATLSTFLQKLMEVYMFLAYSIFPIRRTEAFDDNVNINRKEKREGMPDISTVEV